MAFSIFDISKMMLVYPQSCLKPLKSTHFIKYTVDPEKGGEKIFCRMGKDAVLDDLVHALGLIIFGTYRGFFQMKNGRKLAESFRAALCRMVNDDTLWKEPESDKN